MRTVKRIVFWLGVLMVAAAVGLQGYNLVQEQTAGAESETAVQAVLDAIPAVKPTEPGALGYPLVMADYQRFPEMEMPESQRNGLTYIGVLEIPALELELPIQTDWAKANLNFTPARYVGSAYQNNMILCGHNFSVHFGKLNSLQLGDAVTFTDMDGNVFRYEVIDFERIDGTDFEGMLAGDWDLTLFTCTTSRVQRITVRCGLVEEIPNLTDAE